MMDYIKKAEEKLYAVPVLRQRLQNYEAARDKVIRRAGPAGVAPIDLTKPAVKSSKPEDDFSAAEKIAYYQNKIDEVDAAIKQVTDIVDLLRPEDQGIIELRFFKMRFGRHLTKFEIARLLYISEASVFRRTKKAVSAFANLFPW